MRFCAGLPLGDKSASALVEPDRAAAIHAAVTRAAR